MWAISYPRPPLAALGVFISILSSFSGIFFLLPILRMQIWEASHNGKRSAEGGKKSVWVLLPTFHSFLSTNLQGQREPRNSTLAKMDGWMDGWMEKTGQRGRKINFPLYSFPEFPPNSHFVGVVESIRKRIPWAEKQVVNITHSTAVNSTNGLFEHVSPFQNILVLCHKSENNNFYEVSVCRACCCR